MIRAYHDSRGDGEQRDEVITTIFSHPSNAACARTAGLQGRHAAAGAGDGRPDVGALRAAVSERTAALLITNPEDTGIYNAADRRVRSRRPRGRRPGLLRPGQRQRHPRHHPSPRRRLRPLPLQPAQDLLDAARLRWPGGGCRGVTGEAGAVPALPASSRTDGERFSLDYELTAVDRQDATLVWRGSEPRARLRLDHEPGRRGPARGRRDRRAQQQLPPQGGAEDSRHVGSVRRGRTPRRAGALQLEGAGRRHRRPPRGDRHAR